MKHRRRVLAVVGALIAATTACAADRAERRIVRVAAASSLTDVFTALADVFERTHPEFDLRLDFGASSSLARSINEGAEADVFASADATSMGAVIDAGNASSPEVLARNRLTIVVEKGNPKRISSLADLAGDGVVFVLCAAEVPCGRLGDAAIEKAGVDATPASREENVKAVLTKVRLGEADAGIVYVTDARSAAADVDQVAIEGADDPALEAVYLMALTTTAEEPAGARAFVDFVFSEDGQARFLRAGFLAP